MRTFSRRIRLRIVKKLNRILRSLLDGTTMFPTLSYFISPWYQIVRSQVAISSNFIALEQPIRAEADRADRRNAAITNYSAAQWLHRWKKSQREWESIERNALDQFVLASEVKPKRFRSRYQAKSFQGPTARQDAESAERSKWLDIPLKN